MAKINFGGVVEDVVTREEFPLEKARQVLANESRNWWLQGCEASWWSGLRKRTFFILGQ